MTDPTPLPPQPVSLIDFLTARVQEEAIDDPLRESLSSILDLVRAADDPRTPQMAAVSNALAYVGLTLAQAFADHPDYQSSWRLR